MNLAFPRMETVWTVAAKWTLVSLLSLTGTATVSHGQEAREFWRNLQRTDDATPGYLSSFQIAPDGSRFVVGNRDGVVTLLQRDGEDGALALSASSFLGVVQPQFHPHGSFLYALEGNDALVVHEWDRATDELSLARRYVLGDPELPSPLDYLTSLEISPDGKHLYLFWGLSHGWQAWVADIDTETGLISATRPGASWEIAYGFALSRDGRYALAPGPEHLFVEARDPVTGGLTTDASLFVEGFGQVSDIVQDGESAFLIVRPNGVWHLELSATGHTLRPILDATSCCGEPFSPQQALTLPGGKVLLAAGSQIGVFDRTSEGWLAHRQTLQMANEGAELGDCALDLRPDRIFLFCVANQGNGRIALAEVEPNGALRSLDRALGGDRLPDGVSQVRTVAASLDGRHLYVGSRAFDRRDDTLATVSLDPILGTMRTVETFEAASASLPGFSIWDAAISVDGAWLYAAGDLGIDQFSREAGTGVLTHHERFVPDDSLFPDGLENGHAIVATPDGRHLILATVQDRATFCHRGTVGSLVTVQLGSDGRIVSAQAMANEAGVPWRMALAPDGRHLYVVSWEGACTSGVEDDAAALSVYQREDASGELVLVQTLRDAHRFFAASSLLVSPDGRYVSTWSDTLSIFRRDGVSGSLLFSDELGSDVLPRPERAVQSPDGRWVHGDVAVGTAPAGHPLWGQVTYRRDFATGLLSLASFDDTPRPASTALALSPNGESLFRFDAAGVSWLQRNCVGSDDTLCLRSEDRFKVEVDWQDFDGDRGRGRLVADGQSSQSGLLYFFRPDNWEMLVKIVNGCSNNGHFWVFGAATTNVAYSLRVTDTWTGTTATYENALGTASPAITDTTALATCDVSSPSGVEPLPEVHRPGQVLPIDRRAGADDLRVRTKMGQPGSCDDTGEALCLLDGRFRASVQWRAFDGREGAGARVPIPSDDSGLFSFFTPTNWEMLVKVIDGCAANDRFWVFGAASTNVAYDLTVTDTLTGETRIYENPLGTAAPAIVDTQAFASCP